MKRMSMILMACLMVLGMSQCKKENQNASTEPEGVKITLNVDNGGERVTVTPGETVTSVTFDDGDVILVANGGHYVGSLTRINEAFTGTITAELTTSDKLHFFFVGNKVVPSSLTEGSSTGCTVDMSDQSDGPAVVSYASMAYDGSSSVTASVKLLNKASGLVKFTTNIGTTNDITIAGVYNKMNITFGAEPTIATDQTERGTIKLNRYTGDNDNKTFLAVIPEQSGVNGASVTVTGFTADNIDIPPVTESMNGAMSITLTAAPSVPEGAINGLFTINADGDQVWFSQGNLQYDGLNWSFHANQYDRIYTSDGEATGYPMDLFCWGNVANPAFNGDTSITGTENLSGSTDWGSNIITNGGNTANFGWRTLSMDEWTYLFNTRTASTVSGTANARFAKAYLFGTTHGVILFPDSYTHPTEVAAPTGINKTNNTSWSSNKYTTEQWAKMEEAGAVFLPVTGIRIGKDIQNLENSVYGLYWSSTATGIDYAYRVYIRDSGLNPSSAHDRTRGHAVRLVKDAE